MKTRDVDVEAVSLAADLQSDNAPLWPLYRLLEPSPCPAHGIHLPKPHNCRQNPFCLQRMGLEKWSKLAETDKKESITVERELVPRDPTAQPCGLTNAANFCYVNSFLQIWFNDAAFRQIIFDFRPSSDYRAPPHPAMDVERVMNALQKLFYIMHATPYEDTEATELIDALRLNREQHDAHEFTTVFFDALDRNLRTHPNGAEIQQAIHNRFTGTIREGVFCDCGKKRWSVTEQLALQLHIDGHTTFSQAVEAYLHTEKLTDFACDSCGQRGTSSRRVQLGHLPPVLLVYLQRYKFDQTKSCNRKLSHPIQYPRRFSTALLQPAQDGDESPAGEEFEYELAAVMIHEGSSTDCGHYYDIVRHPDTDVWWNYNDENVKQAKPPGVERENPNPPHMKNSKWTMDLRACYGLVYRRVDERVRSTDLRLPPANVVDEWKLSVQMKFACQTSEMETKQREQQRLTDESHARLQALWEALEVPDKARGAAPKRPKEITFIPTQLLLALVDEEYDEVLSLKKTSGRQKKSAATTAEECQQEDDDQSTDGGRRVRKAAAPREAVGRRLNVEEASCSHGRVSVLGTLSGAWKAVRTAGVEQLLRDYGLSVARRLASGEWETPFGARLPTAADLCVQCAKDFRSEGEFRKLLEKDVREVVTPILRDKKREQWARNLDWRTRLQGQFFIAKKELQNYARLALNERSAQAEEEELRSSQAVKFVIAPSSHLRSFNVQPIQRRRVRPPPKSSPTEDASPPKQPRVSATAEEQPDKKDDDGRPTPPTLDEPEPISMDAADAEEDERETTLPDLLPIDFLHTPSHWARAQEEDVDEVAIEKVEKEEEGPTSADVTNDEMATAAAGAAAIAVESTDQRVPSVLFNEGCQCSHGGFDWNVTRLPVSADEWRVLSARFRRSVELPAGVHECVVCESEVAEKTEHAKSAQEQIRNVRDQLRPIMVRVSERIVKDHEIGDVYQFGLCSRFARRVMAIKVKRDDRSSASTQLVEPCQGCCLCAHSAPAVPVLKDPSSAPFVATDDWEAVPPWLIPISDDEWTKICAVFNDNTSMANKDIDLRPIALQSDGMPADLCDDCAKQNREEQERAKFNYERGADIYIRLQSDDTGLPPPTTSTTLDQSPQAQNRPHTTRSGRRTNVVATTTTAAVATNGQNGKSGKQQVSAASLLGSGNSSTTRRALIKIKIESTQTIRLLKVAICRQRAIAPSDQLLFLDPLDDPSGQALEDATTLADARVPPNNVDRPLRLIVATVHAEDETLSGSTRAAPQRGFSDTALVH